MFKKISIIVATALLMTACGGGSSKDTGSKFVSKNSTPVTVEELKSLGDSIGKDAVSTKKLRTTSNLYESKADNSNPNGDSEVCRDGGSINFDVSNNSQDINFDAKNCKEDGVEVDGAFSAKSSGGDDFYAKITRDIKTDDKNEDVKIFVAKGSYLQYSNKRLSSAFDISVNDKHLKADNIVVTVDDSKNGVFKININSGSLNVDRYYFEVVDQAKDFVLDENGLSDGVLNLKDGAGHKVQLSAKSGKLVLKVDENGDGVFSESETLSEDLSKEDFSL